MRILIFVVTNLKAKFNLSIELLRVSPGQLCQHNFYGTRS